MYYYLNNRSMNLLRVILIGFGCVLLGVAGGFAARSVWAGVVLGVFVFIGWVLWRLFKFQQPKSKQEAEISKDD
jgi:Flp pilus assembly protein TadB